MVLKNESSALRQFWPWWRWLVTGLSALALAFSAYLAWHYVSGGSVIGCSGGNSCDQVLNSRWSSVAGLLPVSGLAMGTYLAMLTAGFFIGPATDESVQRLAWRAMLILTGAAAGSAVWFIVVQKWFIGSFCPYCMATHITGLLLAALVIWRAPKNLFPVSIFRFRLWSVVGVALAGILAVCQIAFTPPPVYRGGESQNELPALDPNTVPLAGSPDAPCVVTLLFDYKCPHCEQLHWMLHEAIRRYGGKLAFALCPAPLNTKCNPYVPRDVDEFKDSCELAKIALAVWVANRESFSSFDSWMFSFESGDRWRPRTLDAARAKAVELIGREKLDSALADPWVEQYLQTCVQIYGQTTKGGNNAVPKLVFGSRWVIPQPNNADDLVSILHDSLAVPAPDSAE